MSHTPRTRRPNFRVVGTITNKSVGSIVLLECDACGGLVSQLSQQKHTEWHGDVSGDTSAASRG